MAASNADGHVMNPDPRPRTLSRAMNEGPENRPPNMLSDRQPGHPDTSTGKQDTTLDLPVIVNQRHVQDFSGRDLLKTPMSYNGE